MTEAEITVKLWHIALGAAMAVSLFTGLWWRISSIARRYRESIQVKIDSETAIALWKQGVEQAIEQLEESFEALSTNFTEACNRDQATMEMHTTLLQEVQGMRADQKQQHIAVELKIVEAVTNIERDIGAKISDRSARLHARIDELQKAWSK